MKMSDIRSPICVCIGHVDHGKSSILDRIRGSSIVNKEAGKITQAIGASIIPLSTIEEISGDLLKSMKTKCTIPGLMFIDTPGHAAFTSLRKRGGNLADIAILVIDINEGPKPQTLECIEILKQLKTPFIVAANKIDLISGWRHHDCPLLESIEKQSPKVKQLLDQRLYELVGKLSEFDFNSERFDRIDDFTKQIAIVPTSAATGDGIPELLMVLTGLAQKFLEKCLSCDVSGIAKGTVLEVKEEKGLGTTLDVILYDGTLKTNDIIVIGGMDKPIVTKVRALFEPKPLTEMRDKSSKFIPVKIVKAATGVKISAPEIDEVIAGMPIRSCSSADLKKTKEDIQKEVKEALIEVADQGIIIKADSLGSLEALVKLLKEREIDVRKATIGDITKKDISDAESNYEKDPLKSVILGFNIKDVSKLCNDHVKVIISDVIYKLIDDFEKWQIEKERKEEEEELKGLIRPGKIQIMAGYIFRQSGPAVCGVDILEGVIKVGTPLMKDGKILTEVKSIQLEKENINEAE